VEGVGEEEAGEEAGVGVWASPLGVDESFCAPLEEGDFSEVMGCFILLE